MPASPADSALYGALFNDAETAQLFSDSAELRALLLVAGSLAKVQGGLGLIPSEAAAFLHRASFEVQIDPAGLAAETARQGQPLPGLIQAFHKAAEAPEFSRHFLAAAAPEAVLQTARALRLKRLASLWQERLAGLTAALAPSASAWAAALAGHQAALARLTPELSRAGAVTPEVAADLARALGLGLPAGTPPLAEFATFMAGLTQSLARMAEDLTPEAPGLPLLQALAIQAQALAGALSHEAALVQILALPQLCILTGRALSLSARA